MRLRHARSSNRIIWKTFTFFLTDGSNSTLSEIDDDSLSNLPQLERLPVAADHDPAVDVSSTPSDSRFPSPARQSPRAASILKVRRQDFANASSQRSKKGNSSQAGKEQNASVGSTLIRVEKARAAASSSKLLRVQPPHVLAISAAPRVQQSRSSIARTQVQSQRAATVPSKSQRKKLPLAAKPKKVKCWSCRLPNHIATACPFPNPFPKGVKRPPPRELKPPSSSTDASVVADWTDYALRKFQVCTTVASNSSSSRNACIAVEVCLKRRDEGALRKLNHTMTKGNFTQQHWSASQLPETLVEYLTEVKGNEGDESLRQFFMVRFGCFLGFNFSKFLLSPICSFALTGYIAHSLLKQFLVFFVFFLADTNYRTGHDCRVA